MNNEDVRGIFARTLDDTPPLSSVTTDDIVVAGQRKVRTRRSFMTAGSVTAGALAIVLLGAVLQQGGPGANGAVNAGSSPSASASSSASGQPSPVNPELDPTGAYTTALKDAIAFYIPDATVAPPSATGSTDAAFKWQQVNTGSIQSGADLHIAGEDVQGLSVELHNLTKEDGLADHLLDTYLGCDPPEQGCTFTDSTDGSRVATRVIVVPSNGSHPGNNGDRTTFKVGVVRADGTMVILTMETVDDWDDAPTVEMERLAAMALSMPQAPVFKK